MARKFSLEADAVFFLSGRGVSGIDFPFPFVSSCEGLARRVRPVHAHRYWTGLLLLLLYWWDLWVQSSSLEELKKTDSRFAILFFDFFMYLHAQGNTKSRPFPQVPISFVDWFKFRVLLSFKFYHPPPPSPLPHILRILNPGLIPCAPIAPCLLPNFSTSEKVHIYFQLLLFYKEWNFLLFCLENLSPCFAVGE